MRTTPTMPTAEAIRKKHMPPGRGFYSEVSAFLMGMAEGQKPGVSYDAVSTGRASRIARLIGAVCYGEIETKPPLTQGMMEDGRTITDAFFIPTHEGPKPIFELAALCSVIEQHGIVNALPPTHHHSTVGGP